MSIGLAAWSFAATIGWLVPIHAAPWPTVYQELPIAFALLPISIWLLLVRGTRWQADLFCLGFAGAALIPLAQAAASMYFIAGEASLASLYLLGVASAVLIGRTAESFAPGRLVDALFGSLLLAGLVSTGLALAQWLGVDTFGDLLGICPPGGRPIANIGQPNNLATLLVWALVALWRSHRQRHMGAFVAVLVAAFLLVGVTLTQSRAGFIEVLMCCGLAFFARGQLGTTRQWPAWVGLLIWFVLCCLTLDPLTRAWSDFASRSLLDAASPNERMTLLRVDFSAIAAHPWSGIGWNQNVVAHVALADRFPMHGTVANAHNLVLDLLIWNGVPLGLLLTAGLLVWCLRTLRRLKSGDDFLLALSLATFALHTMLELPHVLAYFLAPAAIIAGTLNARVKMAGTVRLRQPIAAAFVVAWACVFALLAVEYRDIQIEESDAALQSAWPGTPIAPKAPRAYLLASLQEALRDLRIKPRRDMDAETLERFRRAVTRYPTPSGLFRYAEASTLNGDAMSARWALGRLCALHRVDLCAAAAKDWKTLTASRYPELAAVDVPVPN